MATKTIILTTTGATTPDTSSGAYVTFPMPDAQVTRCIVPLSDGVPTDFYAISAVYLIIRSASTGNLYLRVGTTRFDLSAEGAVESVTGSYAAYAGGAGTGITEFISLPSAAWSTLTDLNAGDILNFVIDRDASNASDTYNTDLDVIGIKFVYDIGWAAGSHYASQSDMEYRIGTARLAQYTNDTANATTPNATIIEKILTDVDATIDGIVGVVYTTPFPTTPDLIKDIATDLAVYKAMQRRPVNVGMPEEWKNIGKECMQTLRDIAAMKIELPSTATIVSATSEIENAETYKLVDFNDEDNAMYEY